MVISRKRSDLRQTVGGRRDVDALTGMVILASNLSKNMDEAFMRRLRVVVEFPPPSEAERRRIWERVFPDDLPRAPDVDLGWLAQRFDLVGGHIRNVAPRAAFLIAEAGDEAVGMDQILVATRREYTEMGKIVDSFVYPGGSEGEEG
jgi:SpoVK/Ycf46/Vps4 family AAA+-type ATPase